MNSNEADDACALSIDSLSKTYGKLKAVSDLSVQCNPGDILGLVGRNGAGKTTTLRTIAGILKPTSGRVCINGFDVAADEVAAKRSVGYIPDDPALFENLTVWEHLAFTAATYGVAEFEEPALHLLQDFDMFEKRDALASSLSRGMRQKVSITCSLLHNPALLLFDEPMTGLDPPAIKMLQQRIRQCAQSGQAVVVSSHLLSVVSELCTHVLLLHEGVSRWQGATSDLPERDATLGHGLEQVFFALTDGTS